MGSQDLPGASAVATRRWRFVRFCPASSPFDFLCAVYACTGCAEQRHTGDRPELRNIPCACGHVLDDGFSPV